MLNNLYPSVLYLEDGTSFKGWSLFRLLVNSGEIVFNTGMTGYQEIFTDPSYAGQMVVFTYPELGNTGLNHQDSESKIIYIKALIAKNISSISSNWRSTISLRDFLISKRLPHIFGIDTRSLTAHIRSRGVMNAVILHQDPHFNLVNFKFNDLNKINLVNKVTTKNAYYIYQSFKDKVFDCYLTFKLENRKNLSKINRVVIIDFGIKLNILRKLFSWNCKIFVLPAYSDYVTILSYKPDSVLLSNGPGNPAFAKYSIYTVKSLIYFSNIPIFGICMGHQILNLAMGAKTFKLKFGHRGLNHPAGKLKYSEITSQNHGFAVSKDSLLHSDFSSSFKCNLSNLNDMTVATTLHKNLPVFSVQYHPEASPGPHDSNYLFEVFMKLTDFMKVHS
uniref:Carbamoyl phosphate synthase small chain n=1 Tax=Laurenciella marilzae TaxID=1413812 RepID=A0A1Z1M1P8_9FLOR|nr:carbamoyl phosphate synthase small subunit [Laurenciella marilzae]ARW59704.1 carbamoyl phosphate synthase small subunit [Laurenciella marilzae]